VGFALSLVDALNVMRSKHPPTLPPSPFPSPAPPPVQVSSLDVTKALQSFPSGPAPGPSCLRASHLKEAVFSPSPDHSCFVQRGLVGVVNLLCRGCVAPSILPHLCEATLLAKRRGHLRPIAVGEVLRRLTSRCFPSSLSRFHQHSFSPSSSSGGPWWL
jgi:hypothetical protein